MMMVLNDWSRYHFPVFGQVFLTLSRYRPKDSPHAYLVQEAARKQLLKKELLKELFDKY